MARLSILSLLICICFALYGQIQSLDKMLDGLNYDMRQGPDWDPNLCKPPKVIEDDLKILATVTKNIRTYSLSGCDITVVIKTAKSLGLTVWLGVWVSADRTIFDEQVEVLKQLVKDGLIDDNIIGFNVGSEAVYRKDITAQVAISYVKEFKKILTAHKLKTPVAITDIGDVLYQYPAMIEAGDVVTLNAFPFWEKIPAEEAAAHFKKRIQPLLDLPQVAGKKVIITETGYATGGQNVNASIATPEAGARYLNDFYLLAEEMNWSYYYFCAFDTPYKKEQEDQPLTVEAHFGIFTETGEMKPAYADLKIQDMSGLIPETSESNAGDINDGSTTSAPNPDDNTSSSSTIVPTILMTLSMSILCLVDIL